MQPLTINYILTPFITGFVAYITTVVAIKMLFRPYRRRWYSFGWIGVIPRNRSKLAYKVGVMVGEKLVGEEEIGKALSSESVRNAINEAIENEMRRFLRQDYGTVSDVLEKIGLPEERVIKKLSELLSDGKVRSGLNDTISSIASPLLSKLADTEISTIITEEKLNLALKKAVTEGKWQHAIINELSNRLNNIILSGKSFSDILPEKLSTSTGIVSDFFTDKSLDLLSRMFSDRESCRKIADKLSGLKDKMFSGGGFDHFKLGVINMFLNEDTINDLVQEHLPKLIESLKNDRDTKQRISDGIKGKIDEFLSVPLHVHANKIGFETIYEVRSEYIGRLQKYLASETFADNLTKAASKFVSEKRATIGDAASMAGINLKDEKTARAIISALTGGSTLQATLPQTIYKILQDIHAANIYDYIPKKSFLSAKNKLLEKINEMMENNIPKIMRTINLPDIVEKKINQLSLQETEEVLFDFMKDQFKWINILSFVLGFIFGLAQVFFLILLST